MRTAVIILSLVGSVAALVLGMVWLSDHRSALNELAPYRPLIATDPELSVGLGELESRLRASYALLVAAGLGVFGALAALRDRPGWAGLALLVGGLAPAVFDVEALVFTFFLLLAGLMALGARREPALQGSYRRSSAKSRHA